MCHLAILNDDGLVRRADGTPGLGYKDGYPGRWSVLPLRLTASGHEFLEHMRNEEVWPTLKKSFKDGSVETLRGAARKLFEAYAQKKVKELTGLG